MVRTQTRTFYDIETFKNYFLVVGQDYDSDEYIVLENPTFVELWGFISNRNLVGFYNHHFDDVVVSSLLNRVQHEKYPFDEPIPPIWAYDMAQTLMNKESDAYYSGLLQPTEDIMKYRDFETDDLNLKSFESVLGMDIIESAYDFNKPLPRQGKRSTKRYCMQDVSATKKAFKFLEKRGSVDAVIMMREWVAQKLQVNPDSLIKSSTNSLLIKLLKNPSYDRSNFFNYMKQCDFSYAFSDPKFVEWYNKIVQWADDPLKIDEPILEFMSHDIIWKFALGGGHAHHIQTMFKDLFDDDYGSLYPSIIINMVGLGEECTAMFKEIVDTRLANKKTNKKLAQALKLMINSLYGLTRSIKSGAQLYNKYLSLDICIAGQCILYDMALRYIEAGATLVNVNTDGIIYKANGSEERIKEIREDCSKRTNISIDSEEMAYYFARDVNNYFTLDKEGEVLTRKGVFSVKPFYNNLASPNYVIELLKSKALKKPFKTMKDLYNEKPEDFILRAKNNKNFEFNYVLEYEFERYGKRGQVLKGKDYEYLPIFQIGKQYRGYATIDGYNLKNYNMTTGKFTESGALKTGSIKTKFTTIQPRVEILDLLYYQTIADDLLESMVHPKLLEKYEKNQEKEVAKLLKGAL